MAVAKIKGYILRYFNANVKDFSSLRSKQDFG
jgi:hypothetical protein